MLEPQITAQIIDHMNDDHADAVLLYVQTFGGRADATAAQLVEFDTRGMVIRFSTGGGDESECRIPFDAPLDSAGDARRRLVEMAQQARARLAGS